MHIKNFTLLAFILGFSNSSPNENYPDITRNIVLNAMLTNELPQKLPEYSSPNALANKLFIELTVLPSLIDQQSFDNLFQTIAIQCSRHHYKEIDILNLLLDKCEKDLNYYDLIKKKKSNYKSVLAKFGISLALGALIYRGYKITKQHIEKKAQEMESIKNKLYRSDPFMYIYVGHECGSIHYNIFSSASLLNLKNELQHLINLNRYNSPEFILTKFFLFSMTITIDLGIGIWGINELLDQLFPHYYYKKYYMVKAALEKQKNIYTNNLNQTQ